MTKAQIKSAARELDPHDLEDLAEKLLLSIGADESSAIDAAWLAEAHRRDADYAAGRISTKSVNEMIERLLLKRK